MQPRTGSATALTPAQLAERTLHRRAVETVIWAMPAVNAELIFQAMRDAKADFNEAVYWSRPVDWKNQTLTPNPDTIYLMPIFNTKEVGPMVLEIPPADGGSSIIGSIDEAWQTAIEDVGPAGVDKGKAGGKPRNLVFDGVFQRQALGRRPVLPDDHRGQDGPATGWGERLSLARARQRAGQLVLVGNGLRSRDARPDP